MKIHIVGGGITALSTAIELIRAGHHVEMSYVPRENSASQAAGGMLSPSCEAEGCSKTLILAGIESCRLYPSWVADIERQTHCSTEYNTKGTLLVAQHNDHYRDLEHLHRFHEQYHIETEWLSRAEVRGKEPNLTRQVGGLFCPHDTQISPRRLQQALQEYLRLTGTIHTGSKIDIVWNNSQTPLVEGVSVDGQKRTADIYVLCDGAWTVELLHIPIRPVKGQYIIIKGNNLLQHVTRTPNVYIIPRANNQTFLGATMEEEGFNSTQTVGATMDLLYHAFQILPEIYECTVVETGCGFRPAMRDNHPILGQTSVENLYCNTGHYRHGIMLAPYLASMFAKSLETPSIIPTEFSTLRYPISVFG